MRYLLSIASGFLSIFPSAALILLITYSISILHGSPKAMSWGELLGEHASRWIGPMVRNSQYENGLSAEFQRWFIVPALLITGLLGNLLKAVQEYCIEDLGEKIARDLRNEVTTAYLNSSYPSATQTPGSLLANFFGEDAREIRQCFTRLCGSIPVELISSLIYFCILALLDTQLFVLFFAIFLPAGLIVRGTGKYLRSLARTGINVQTELTQSFLEKMKGWQTIQTFAAHQFELLKFNSKNGGIFDIWRRSARAKSLSAPSVEWLGISAGACVLVLALRRVGEGALPSSILTAFLVTVAQLSNSFQTVVNQLNTTKKGTAALRRLSEFLDHQVTSGEQDIPIGHSKEVRDDLTLKANSISLSHPVNHSQFLFRDLNIELSAGDSLAILGPSGSGKSTFLECIAGLRSPTSGTIEMKIDGTTVQSNPLIPNFVNVTYLAQEPFVFDDTIGANVAYPEYFIPDSPLHIKKIKDSLRHACLDYKNLNDPAFSLSGGERQRLAFARGFHSEPKIWMIDEGTSALDSKTELDLMMNLFKQSPDSIKIIVAHRTALKTMSNKHLFIGQHQKGSHL